jgi:flagellar biosynthesis component FlhA
LANNDELIKENAIQSLDMNKLMSFTDNLIQAEQEKQKGQIEESAENENTAKLPLKSLEDFITNENLDSVMNMAKSIINPSTLSLFSHLSNSINRHEGNTDLKGIEQIIEQLSSDLKKVHQDLIEVKYDLSEIRLLHSSLKNEIESIKSRKRKKFLWF